jgi:hypothetical protein
MEPFFDYASVMGSTRLRPDQFQQLLLSRGLYRNDPNQFTAYVQKQLAADYAAGKQVVFLDTVGTGETFGILRRIAARAAAAHPQSSKPVFMALPEEKGAYGGATPAAQVETAVEATRAGKPETVVDLGFIPEVARLISSAPRTTISAAHFENGEPAFTAPAQVALLQARARAQGMLFLKRLLKDAPVCTPERMRTLLRAEINSRK